jgi:NAD(P)-dependent dehydrogenase (short-subunit alcohol dehydrogenase family)
MAPIALVTGTSTGIGLSASILLAKAGFEVIATLRNPEERAKALRSRAETEGVRLDIRELDVASDESVRQCVDGVLQRHGRIDVLVNNAGVGYFGSLEHTSMEALRRTMEVNFFGVWRVTQAVFPSMRERRSGRILTVSSISGLVGQPFGEAYSASKFAVEGFMESLSQVARELGIHVSLIQPGPVATEFINSLMTPNNNGLLGETGPYKAMFDSYITQARAFFTEWQTGDEVGRIVVEAATAAQPPLRYYTSKNVRDMVTRKSADLTATSSVAFPQLGSR